MSRFYQRRMRRVGALVGLTLASALGSFLLSPDAWMWG